MMKFKRITVQPDDLPDWVKELSRRWHTARDGLVALIEAIPTDNPYRQQVVDHFEELMARHEPLVKRLEDGVDIYPDEQALAAARNGYWEELEEVFEAIRRYTGN